ncbi:hypothetical protein [Streptomyces sp. TRM68367]|uniref:hypothetical protein n=1 Tax=Streptomyces sp. TRM68367 TaxID=2758415 RepID=UPI00165B7271|nr:hypothetical protein [Streptomyces sp. TRM68367]MBC9730693.1 hypothetical protein [Streptomyces sp. TRM68367]
MATTATPQITHPLDVARPDDVTVYEDAPGKFTVERGEQVLGVIWDEGEAMTRGRYATWSPFGTGNGCTAGFYADGAEAVDAIARTWPVLAGELAEELNVNLRELLDEAGRLAAEWANKGPYAVFRTMAGRNGEITATAAQTLRERLTPAEEPQEPASPTEPHEVHRETYRDTTIVVTYYPLLQCDTWTREPFHVAALEGTRTESRSADLDTALARARAKADERHADAEILPRLRPLIHSRKTSEHLEKEGEPFTVDEVVYVYAMGAWRRGLVTKVGRTRVTVAYATTPSAEQDRVFRKASEPEWVARAE